MSFAENSVEVLERYVGRSAADTCVRGSALSIGKFADTLSVEDLPALEGNVRRLLGPIVPPATLDAIVEEIRQGGA